MKAILIKFGKKQAIFDAEALIIKAGKELKLSPEEVEKHIENSTVTIEIREVEKVLYKN